MHDAQLELPKGLPNSTQVLDFLGWITFLKLDSLGFDSKEIQTFALAYQKNLDPKFALMLGIQASTGLTIQQVMTEFEYHVTNEEVL